MNLLNSPWLRFVGAVLTGAIWAWSFPRVGLAGFAWLAPGLLLAVTLTAPSGLAMRVAYIAGIAHYFISLSWLRFIPFPAGAYAAWVALTLFLALVPACWVWLCQRAGRSLGVLPDTTTANSWASVSQHLASARWWPLQAWCLVCAAIWVASEMLLARLFGGFPWNLLGASQYRVLPLIQLASITGVYGVSFFMVWFSLSLGLAITLLIRQPDRPARWRRPLVFPGLMLLAVTGGGFWGILNDEPDPQRITVALVQPSIPQSVIFDPDASTNRFDTLLRLTEQALATQPDLVLWPEASLPGGLSQDNFEKLLQRVRTAGGWMIFGADDVEATDNPDGTETVRAYNAAFLVNPRGEVAASYRKQRLVMFGEYIPLVRWFPFLRHLAPIGDGLEAGSQPVPFDLGSLGARVSVLICFEDNFPQQARQHASGDVDILVNLTNNAWFGESSAQWQHAANAVFRAIENGIPLIRCANNGLTCWIDRRGRLYSDRVARSSSIYAAGFESVVVRFGSPRRTIYHRVGDVFGWGCVAVTIGMMAARLRLPRPVVQPPSAA